jgi:hypothetical protein
MPEAGEHDKYCGGDSCARFQNTRPLVHWYMAQIMGNSRLQSPGLCIFAICVAGGDEECTANRPTRAILK